MTEAEELQSILSEPGKAVGKYFDTDSEYVAYIGADARAWGVGATYEPLLGTVVKYGGRDVWDVDGRYVPVGSGSMFDLTRVRKADPNRNLNLKVGMKVRLVNGDVVTLSGSISAASPFRGSNGELYMEDGICRGYTTSIYAGLHICEVISEEKIAGGLLDKVNERLRKVEREIVDIKNAQRELEGLV